MSDWTSEYLQLVEDCEKRESRMTEWECDFVSSIRDRLEAGKALTERQTETLDKIWEKVTKHG